MLLTISTTHHPATDLGFLLHKNPSRPQSFDLSFGKAHVFYPAADARQCIAALLLDIDPVGLVRGRRSLAGNSGTPEQYVNDRPYVASSFLSVAISQIFGSALAGRSRERAELVNASLPLRATLTSLPCRGGEEILRRLFVPLGYEITMTRHALDEKFPQWGESSYFHLELHGEKTVRELLTHLYVLVPVLDGDKHYWIGDAEVEKLLRHGDTWLAAHPERELIVKRYLKHRPHLMRAALEQLLEEDHRQADEAEAAHAQEESVLEEKISLNQRRINAVIEALRRHNVRRVVDLGCGEGKLIRALMAEKEFTEIVGVDVSYRSLEIAQERLKLDRLPLFQRDRVKLMQGSLTYRDKRISGYDAATVIEVIEHLDPHRLASFARLLFEFTRPGVIVLTTPNAEYNVKFETLPAGQLRHRDHRFEWTRAEFETWSRTQAETFGYNVQFAPIGEVDEVVGAPTQMAVFSFT